VRYRGLAKNLHRLEVTAALVNLYTVRRRLLNVEETWMQSGKSDELKRNPPQQRSDLASSVAILPSCSSS
jgi:hypothetical protein